MSQLSRAEVKQYLESHFLPLGLDLENIHINGINNVIEQLVISSRPIIDEALYWVEEGEEPTFDFGTAGVFNHPYSFAEAHREHRLRLPDLESAIRGLLDLRR